MIKAEKNGADVDALDLRESENGRRALNWAAWFNNTNALVELLSMGANIDGTNLTGYTLIHHAAENGSVDATRLLIEAGADFVAVSGGVWSHKDGPAAAVKAFNEIFAR